MTDRSDGAGEAGDAGRIRLQKVLAAAGLGSRRASEELIAAGRVTVDGRVSELGDRVDPSSAVIEVDGDRVIVRDDLVYLALNKPRGVLSSMSDERGRRNVGTLVAELGRDPHEHLFHVGRLDADSEGLLLLTSDGELAHRLMHPSFGVHKTYLATVPGPVPGTVGKALRDGIELADGPVRVDGFRVVDTITDASDTRSIVEVVLHEGRKHIVRRLLAEVGHPVQRLVRTSIGPVHLGGLRAGAVRELSRDEIAGLYRQSGEPAARSEPTGRQTGGGTRGTAARR